MKSLCLRLIYFYPRPPRGGRLVAVIIVYHLSKFLSTPSARRATTSSKTTFWRAKNFYPRPPRGGRRIPSIMHRFRRIFLSTPSARRATSIASHSGPQVMDFYPRPPRGGRPTARRAPWDGYFISIHALREEGDGLPPLLPGGSSRFLSTPSARRATQRHDDL